MMMMMTYSLHPLHPLVNHVLLLTLLLTLQVHFLVVLLVVPLLLHPLVNHVLLCLSDTKN
jgi:hypothetical protein